MIDKIIKRMQEESNSCPQQDEEITLLIGHENYPDRSNINAYGIPFYDKYNIKSVAFLSEVFSLPMFSIISLVVQSHSNAMSLIDGLSNIQNGVYLFAKYLQTQHNMILINEFWNEDIIKDILNDYPQHKILLIGTNHQASIFEGERSLMQIPHPGNQAYVNKARECCETYFLHTFKDNNSSLFLSDFKIKL